MVTQSETILSALLANEPPSARRQSLIIQARAGTGKSTLCHKAIVALEKRGCSLAYAMFNRHTIDEFKSRIGRTDCRINTAHGFGYAVLRSKLKLSSYKPDPLKVHKLLWQRFGGPAYKEIVPLAARLIALAKDAGFGLPLDNYPKLDEETYWFNLADHHNIYHPNLSSVVKCAIAGLQASNTTLTTIDFPDQLYLPLLLSLRPEQFDYVLIDEAQDTNRTKLELYSRMLKPWGAFLIVGDIYQAIYGYTGADHDSMDRFAERSGAKSFPLTTCWRCDKAIIRHAQRFVKDIEARPDAEEGYVGQVTYDMFMRAAESQGTHHLDANAAILCRYNYPIASLAFALLRRGIACRIEGRDVGHSLIALVEELNSETIIDLKQNLYTWYQKEIAKAQKKGEEPSESNNDKYETLLAITALCSTPAELLARLRNMFSDASDPSTPKNVLTLSTVHKAKGREWDRVFILGRDKFMPSYRAKKPWQLQQENNLIYVAITRARHTLIEITDLPEV